VTPTSPTRDDRSSLLLEDRVTRVFRELPGAVAGHDEAVHQVRVAGRRLRVALPLLALKGDSRTLRRAVRVLRRLTRAVGDGRDMDVVLGLFQDRLDALKTTTAEQRALLSRLRAARARSRSQVAEDVLDLDIDGLRRNLRSLLRTGATDAPSALGRVRSLREAQQYFTPVYLLLSLPAMAAQFLEGWDRLLWTYLVPGLNAVFVFRGLLLGSLEWTHAVLTLASTAGYTAISFALAVRLFRPDTEHRRG